MFGFQLSKLSANQIPQLWNIVLSQIAMTCHADNDGYSQFISPLCAFWQDRPNNGFQAGSKFSKAPREAPFTSDHKQQII